MIRYTHELSNELTIILEPQEVAYIHIRGLRASCILGLELLSLGAAAEIKATLISKEILDLPETIHSFIPWDTISIDGVVYDIVNFDIPSLAFNSPNVLYVKNISTLGSGRDIRLSLRGNY